jgi:uncharacterized protein
VEDCQDCGACCFSESETRVVVTDADRARLGDDAARFVAVHEDRSFMRIDRSGPVGRCVALEVIADGRFACGIYQRRPEICRRFSPASDSCTAESALKRDRVRRFLDVWGRRPRSDPRSVEQ